VAHSLSAKKRVRQNLKRRSQNRFRKEEIKEQAKAVTVAATAGDWKKADAELRQLTRKLDRVAVKGTIHRNTASRKRSRMAKRNNALRKLGTGKGGGAATATA
jgi:small subunit ribosomal protein S20